MSGPRRRARPPAPQDRRTRCVDVEHEATPRRSADRSPRCGHAARACRPACARRCAAVRAGRTRGGRARRSGDPRARRSSSRARCSSTARTARPAARSDRSGCCRGRRSRGACSRKYTSSRRPRFADLDPVDAVAVALADLAPAGIALDDQVAPSHAGVLTRAPGIDRVSSAPRRWRARRRRCRRMSWPSCAVHVERRSPRSRRRASGPTAAVIVTLSAAAISGEFGPNTQIQQPAAEVGRLTRSPGRVNSSSSSICRTCASYRVAVAVRRGRPGDRGTRPRPSLGDRERSGRRDAR